MEANPKRLKALRPTFGVHKASALVCRPLEARCWTPLTNAPDPSAEVRELVQPTLSSRSAFDTRTAIRSEFNDAVGLVETAYTALETFDTTTFSLACLRFGIDKLNDAYRKIERAGMPTVDTVSDIEPPTGSNAGAKPAPTRHVTRGAHKKGRRTRKQGLVSSRKRAH